MPFTDTQFWSRVPASMVSTTTEVKVNRDSARVTILFKRDIGSMLRCELTLEEAKIIRRQMNVAIQAIEPPTIQGEAKFPNGMQGIDGLTDEEQAARKLQ